ncbi:hypothetical protein TWF694_002512 [Orbilia ellipsospora]|uniref:MYND-type domain-containing protein n=1 Tax=Orbilia ellipsospora TaxID=2528407 RepID=A0AAV9X8B4_9PEZI
MATDPRCTFCWKPAKDLCGRCKAVRYCGSICQRADWKTHKVFCGLEYPSKDDEVASYRGVLFATDEDKPRFIELPIKNHDPNDSRTASILPKVADLLGESSPGLRSVTWNGRGNNEREFMRGRLVMHCQNYTFQEGFSNFKDERPINLALRKFTGLTKDFDMPGPVVVTKERWMKVDEYMDVEFDDLKDMVDLLIYQMRVSAEHKKIFKNFDFFPKLPSTTTPSSPGEGSSAAHHSIEQKQ